ncbi:eukaryotic translation initiation factor 2-alpha kinase 3 [Trichonephila clavipes]|nr:eukaryotic translation initiation factor 2-alpha kinase 3 [Trichonephila clavipes]
MKEFKIPDKLLRLISLTLSETKIIVKVQNDLSDPLEIKNGVRQGDVLACLLFNLALEKVVWENGTRIWLVPSLDGLLFKYDKLKLEPLPFNAESLLSHSVVLDQSTSVTGGKFKIVYGFHRHTGECSLDGCENFKPISAKDGLIIEQWVQSVNAVDTETAELRWHFRVVEIKIKTVAESSSENTSQYDHSANFENNGLVPLDNFNDLNPMRSLKISLVNGYTARFNQSAFDFTWLYKTSVPLIDVWFIKDRSVLLLDPFADGVEFFSMDSDDGQHMALLFLGAIFQQDNARPHMARMPQDCLHTVTTLPWPARSPDLSPIEFIFDHYGQ